MKCVWTEKVSLLIDGELAVAESREVERHLDACGDCREAHADFLALRRQIASYEIELDARDRQRALERVLATGGSGVAKSERAAQAERPRRAGMSAGVFGLPRLSPVGLAAMLLLTVGVAAVLLALFNSRRAPAEVALNPPANAPVSNAVRNSNNAAASSSANPLPSVAKDSTAGADARDTQEEDGAAAGKRHEPAATGGQRKTMREGLNLPRPQSAGARPRRLSSPAARLDESQVDAATAASQTASNRRESGDTGAPQQVEAGDVTATAARGEAEVIRDAAVTGATQTARHVEQAQLLLRSFRNARPDARGHSVSSDLAYERERSKKLLYENIVLRREAARRGNLPVESLLDSLEPILIDIANLPARPAPAEVREINERMRRQNLVAMLQISSVESAAAARSY